MTRLLLVRHATSIPPVPDGPDEYERPLSDVGQRQAEALVEVLRPRNPSRVLSSPFLRSVQTVAPTAAALGLSVEPRDALREWHSGIAPTPLWEARYRDCWESPDWAAPGGETHRALEARASAALVHVAADVPAGSVVVLGSHGTWIARALHALGCPVDADFWLEMPMPAVFEVTMAGDYPIVVGPGLDAA